jgi:hypothetical protein
MAIAFDAATDGGNNDGATSSHSFSHTCTGTDRILFVGIAGGQATSEADDLTGVTYDSVAMTLVGKRVDADLDRYVYLYVLVNPASGSHTVAISSSTTKYLLAGAVSYTGARQSSQPDNSTTNISAVAATSLTSSLTPVSDGCWIVLVSGQSNSGSPAALDAGTGTTLRTKEGSFGTWGLFDSGGAISPAANTSLEITRNSEIEAIGHVLASFAPAGAGEPVGAQIIFRNRNAL